MGLIFNFISGNLNVLCKCKIVIFGVALKGLDDYVDNVTGSTTLKQISTRVLKLLKQGSQGSIHL